MICIIIYFQKDAEIMRKTTVSQSFALLEDKHHVILEDKHLQVNTCFDLEWKKKSDKNWATQKPTQATTQANNLYWAVARTHGKKNWAWDCLWYVSNWQATIY